VYVEQVSASDRRCTLILERSALRIYRVYRTAIINSSFPQMRFFVTQADGDTSRYINVTVHDEAEVVWRLESRISLACARAMQRLSRANNNRVASGMSRPLSASCTHVRTCVRARCVDDKRDKTSLPPPPPPPPSPSEGFIRLIVACTESHVIATDSGGVLLTPARYVKCVI